jgi:hypothetical protein
MKKLWVAMRLRCRIWTFPEVEFVRNGQEFLHKRVCEIKKAGNPENCQMEKERKNI